uniref:Uncharacterized protein n=1 Tax=Bionectria ochroleuca TaxID=29856 RepID=A0A8H7K1K7_BIOOC
MRPSLVLIGLIAAPALCTPLDADLAAAEAECGPLGVQEWDLNDLPEGTDVNALRKCREHPADLDIGSSLEDSSATPELLESSTGEEFNPDEILEDTSPRESTGLEARQKWSGGEFCPGSTGRGTGADYDYGCTKGWCWRNCNVHLEQVLQPWHHKPWCWLAYNGGNGKWTPCGRWQDCEWSYNNKNAKCGKAQKGKSCKACGCGCT